MPLEKVMNEKRLKSLQNSVMPRMAYSTVIHQLPLTELASSKSQLTSYF